LLDLNGSIFDRINDLAGRSSGLDRLMEFSAQYLVFVIAAIVMGSWLVRAGVGGPNRRVAVYTAVASTAVALLITMIIQHVYTHPRPFVARNDVVLLVNHSADPSFPSEHATAAFAMAAGLGLYRPRFGLLLLSLASLTAFARVFVGIHYPGDVAGGAAIGIVVAVAIWSGRRVLAWLDEQVVVRLIPAALR
jgi:undecaprenyl-diphosphatase